MLTVRTDIPDGFLEVPAAGLHRILRNPTLIHLPGRRAEPLFASVLLHGDEDTGLKAIQAVLAKYRGRELPRALSFLVGNVEAAAKGLRRLEGQPDFNRVWPGAETSGLPEHAMMRIVVDQMRERGVFASIDLHNNTGLNPHYACVNRRDAAFLHLATLFSRTVVYFQRPLGVQSAAFAQLCPAVTVECGMPGNQNSEMHAAAFVEAALRLEHFPAHPVPRQDIDLYHTIAIVKVPEELSFSYGDGSTDIIFEVDIDHMNFRELSPGTRIAQLDSRCTVPPLKVSDEEGREIFERCFEVRDGELLTRRAVMPAMLSTSERAIRQDCLCYLMERLAPAE
jgi:succinylglutamate desuccinylase